jgi:1-acyl-sn-glycerol-3-phosphate acyltransferase
MRSRSRFKALVVFAYVVVFWGALPIGLFVAGRAVDRWVGASRSPWAPGWVLSIAGGALLVWGIAVLRRDGRGLPVSALPPPWLARGGPYRFVRHPIYLGYTAAVWGAALGSGSAGTIRVVAPLFTLACLGYVWFEERGLVRRFGSEYRRYQRQVGLLPRPGLYRMAQALQWFRVLDVRVMGREHVPRRGPAILVYNHSSYLDGALASTCTTRVVHHMATAEVWRSRSLRTLARLLHCVPVRRYRPDPVACRELLRLLADGKLVAIAVEGERSPSGRYHGAIERVARILARLDVPIIPIGLSGNYDVGPRWSKTLRRRPVDVRVGLPLRLDVPDPRAALDAGLEGLIAPGAERVHLLGLRRDRLALVLWRCPACGDEPAWSTGALACSRCKTAFSPTPEGWLRDGHGTLSSLAELVERVSSFPERSALASPSRAARERSLFGRIEPLAPIGAGAVIVSRKGVRFGELAVPLAAIRSTTTERADTLQIATHEEMFQFRIEHGSAFRLELALDRWRGEARRAERTVTVSPERLDGAA